MLPPEAFSISAAQAISDGFNGCAGGTQDDIFRVTVLSWANALGAVSSASIVKAAARGRIGMHISPYAGAPGLKHRSHSLRHDQWLRGS